MRGMVSYTQRSLAMTVCSDRRQGKPSPKRVPVAGVEQVLGLLRSVFRSERAAFPREVAARAPDRAELHLGEAGVARSRTGAARAQAGESIASGVRGGLCPGCCCTSTALITVFRMSVGMT